MNWFESLVAYLFPTILIEREDWREQWFESSRLSFLNVARVFFLMVAIGYILHYYFFDVPMGLAPIERWFAFRFTAAALCILCAVYYFSPLAKSKYYKVPATIMCGGLCISQAFVAQWYGLEAWVFCFFFVIASILALRTTALRSVGFAAIVVAIQTPILLDANVALNNVVSGASVTILITLAVTTTYLTEVRTFLLNQQHQETQEQINQLTLEFSERIKSFIPKVIAERLEAYVNNDKMTVLEASVESLRAKKQDIACIFSDIRGFTQSSRHLDSFVNESVIPEVTVCSDAVERHHGIPRKVGDLIFAYFDADSVRVNVIRAIMSGIEIAQANRAMNATVNSMAIKRYILVSSGEAMVGNFGGLDSSVEITALGSPVNFLSRLDDLTKESAMAELLEPGDLVLCERTVSHIRDLGIDLNLRRVDLNLLNLKIRDFPEADHVFTLKPTDEHHQALAEPYTYIEEHINAHSNGSRGHIRSS